MPKLHVNYQLTNPQKVGFLANRIILSMINEAAHAVHDGIASALSVDNTYRSLLRQPMGPLALADIIGMQTVKDQLEFILEETKDARYTPCPIFQEMIDDGNSGRRAGSGFFDYSADRNAAE